MREAELAMRAATKFQAFFRKRKARQAFVQLNEDASRSPNYQSQEPDDLEGLVSLLSSDAVKSHEEILLRVLKSLKILTRKYDNRVRLGEYIVEDPVQLTCGHPDMCRREKQFFAD